MWKWWAAQSRSTRHPQLQSQLPLSQQQRRTKTSSTGATVVAVVPGGGGAAAAQPYLICCLVALWLIGTLGFNFSLNSSSFFWLRDDDATIVAMNKLMRHEAHRLEEKLLASQQQQHQLPTVAGRQGTEGRCCRAHEQRRPKQQEQRPR
jgi:hypothetical protein